MNSILQVTSKQNPAARILTKTKKCLYVSYKNLFI